MYRFFVRNEQVKNNTITIKNRDVNHIKNVLRFSLKDKIEIVDLDYNQIYICEIILLSDDFIECKIISKKNESNESNIYIHVLQGIPKFEKMELIIEKCTELGVSEFTPVIMKRCVVKLDSKSENKKILRWRKIAEVAAKQSKRDRIPKVNECINIKNIYDNIKDYDIVLIAYEMEKQYFLKQELLKLKNCNSRNIKIAIIIGPEGGFSEEEIDYLSKFNYRTVSLGKRILRTETAPIVMVANIIYELEGGKHCETE